MGLYRTWASAHARTLPGKAQLLRNGAGTTAHSPPTGALSRSMPALRPLSGRLHSTAAQMLENQAFAPVIA